jgi:hypothetical protein
MRSAVVGGGVLDDHLGLAVNGEHNWVSGALHLLHDKGRVALEMGQALGVLANVQLGFSSVVKFALNWMLPRQPVFGKA